MNQAKLGKLFPILSLLLIFLTFYANAAIITSTGVGGPWTSGSTWVGGTVPSASDTAVLAGGAIVEVSGTVNVGRVVFTDGVTVGIQLVLLDGATFTVSGAVQIGNTNANNQDNVFNVGNATATCAGLTLLNSTDGSRRAVVRINNGSLTVNGSVNYSAGTQEQRRRVEINGNGTFTINGPVSNVATLALSNTSTVTYNHSGNSIIVAANYGNLIVNGMGQKNISTTSISRNVNNLTVSGGANLILSTNHTVTGVLTLNNGVITTNANNLELSENATITGDFGPANHINLGGRGLFTRRSNTLEGFRMVYPIGASGAYSPFVLDSLEANLSGNPGSRFIELQVEGVRHGVAVGIGNALNRFWRIRTGNISAVTKAACYFQYADTDVPNGVTETSLDRVANLSTSGWAVNLSGSSVNHTSNRIWLNSPNTLLNGDWTLGVTAAFPPVLPFVYTVQNGNWSTNSVWSNNQVPNANTNVVIQHALDNPPNNATANDIVIANSGSLTIRQNSFIANGKCDVFGGLFDFHSSGINSFRGKFTLHESGSVNFSGSGGGANFNFFDDVEIHGNFNLNGGMTFNRTLKNVIRFKSTQPIVSQRNGIISLVDTLYIEVNHPDSPNFSVLGGDNNFTIGDSTILQNLVVYNMSNLNVAGGIDAKSAADFTRKFTQAPNALLRVTRANPFGGGLVLDFEAAGNTVDYGAASAQNVIPTNYHHLTISGDRADRIKTILGGQNINVAGNLTIENNGAQLQFGNNSNGQTLTVNGDFIIQGNGRFVSAPSGSGAKNRLIIGGKLINTANSNPALNAFVNDSTFTRVRFKGSGTIAEGNGRASFSVVEFTGADSTIWSMSGLTSLDDTLYFNTPKFRANRGNFFVSNSARILLTGTSNDVILNNFTITDRADRTAQVNQRVPLTIDSTFALNITGQAGGAFYDIRGTRLTLNGPFTMGINSNNSALRADSNTVIVFNGAGQTPNFILRNDFRMLKSLTYNRSSHNLSFGQPVTIYDELNLTAGNIQPNNRINMRTGSTVKRAKGRLLANLSGPGVYNVEYLDSLVTGPELVSIATIGRLTINARPDDIISFANSPQVGNDLVYVNGVLEAQGNNFIRLTANSVVRVNSTTENRLFPVGIGTRRGFFNLKVNSIGSGNLELRPVFNPHPARANAPNFLNKYLTIGGNATNMNYDISINYDDNEVVGTETDFNAYFYNGSEWSVVNGTLDVNTNVATMTALTQLGDFTAGTNMGDTLTTLISDITAKSGLVFPNPAYKVVNVAFDHAQYANGTATIMNIQGKKLKSVALTSMGTGTILINDLPTGMYLLEISGPAKKSEIRLFVVSK